MGEVIPHGRGPLLVSGILQETTNPAVHGRVQLSASKNWETWPYTFSEMTMMNRNPHPSF
jgi:hypothetical protein